jgi:hypothetical protein
VDRSLGTLTYYSAPFYPRNSEGVFGMDLWLQKQESDGSWSEVGVNRGYERVGTPNPGPSQSYTYSWGPLVSILCAVAIGIMVMGLFSPTFKLMIDSLKGGAMGGK